MNWWTMMTELIHWLCTLLVCWQVGIFIADITAAYIANRRD